MQVKFRRWGPYVWWICPSRKCNFENKTDLVFVQREFETKCQYCNTPILIKLNGNQLSLESTAIEEEAHPAAPVTPKASAPTVPPQSTTASTVKPPVSTPAAPNSANVSAAPKASEQEKPKEAEKKTAS